MSDLISRQAALDCFHDWIDRHGDVHTPDEMAEYRAIEELPSVEPEKRTEECTETHACDLISRQAAIDALHMHLMYRMGTDSNKKRLDEWINNLPSAQPEQRWIPIKWHDCTDEDREKYGFSNDIVAVFDCEMPDDDQPILVTTSHGYVNQDVCYIDDGFSLDSGWDWIDDIKAWMPLPEPYRGGVKDEHIY